VKGIQSSLFGVVIEGYRIVDMNLGAATELFSVSILYLRECSTFLS
jgi:hypothetical protein